MRASLLLPCTLAACSSVVSSGIRTSGMSAAFGVSANGDGTSVANAQLFSGNSLTNRVDLSSGDSLVASAAGQTQTMARSDVLNLVSYAATFQGLDQGGTTFTIALSRTGDTSAPNSICTMPLPFTVTSPAGGASFSRASDAAVAYGPAGTGDSMTWLASGACIATTALQYVTGDPGTFAIPAGTLQPVDAQHATAMCSVSLTVYRSRTGTLDPAYGYGGSIFAQQTRTVTFTSTP